MAKKNVIKRVRDAEQERQKALAELENKIAALKQQSEQAAEKMAKALHDENLNEYSRSKMDKALADDSAELYTIKMQKVRNCPLFEDYGAVLHEIRAEETNIEIAAMQRITKLLKEVCSIGEAAKKDFLELEELVPIIAEKTGKDVPATIPAAIIGVIRNANGYINNPFWYKTDALKSNGDTR